MRKDCNRIITKVFRHTIASIVLLAMLTQASFAQQAKPSDGKAQDAKARQIQRGNQYIQQAYKMTLRKNHNVESYTQVIKTCEKAMQLGVSHANAKYASTLMSWAHNRRGKIYSLNAARLTHKQFEQKSKFAQQAMSDFETAINLDGSRWRAYHNRGVSLAQLGKLKEALADFNKSIKLNSKFPNAYYNRGQVYYEQGKYTKAITEYNQALKLNPKDAEFYNSRGHALYRLGRFRESLEDYNRSLSMNPNNGLVYCNRGDVFADLKNYSKAALDYRQAIRLSPNSGQVYQSAAWLMATCPDKRFRDSKKALVAAQKALELDGADDYRYLDTLAAAYANAARYDDAKDTVQEAIRMAPKKEGKVLKTRLAVYEKKQPYRESNSRVARSPSDTKTK